MDRGGSCPVCTLYLREGITMEAHLNTHPKEQVISALLKAVSGDTNTSNSIPALSGTNNLITSLAPNNSFLSTLGSSSNIVSSIEGNNNIIPNIPGGNNLVPNNSMMSAIVPQPNLIQPVQQVSGFIPIAPRPMTQYLNQPQLTRAVTYQQFLANNSANMMPQYIQVPTIVTPGGNFPIQTYQYIPQYSNQYVPPVNNMFPTQVSVISQHVISKKPGPEVTTQCNITSDTAAQTQEQTVVKQSVITSVRQVETSTSSVVQEVNLPPLPVLTPKPALVVETEKRKEEDEYEDNKDDNVEEVFGSDGGFECSPIDEVNCLSFDKDALVKDDDYFDNQREIAPEIEEEEEGIFETSDYEIQSRELEEDPFSDHNYGNQEQCDIVENFSDEIIHDRSSNMEELYDNEVEVPSDSQQEDPININEKIYESKIISRNNSTESLKEESIEHSIIIEPNMTIETEVNNLFDNQLTGDEDQAVYDDHFEEYKDIVTEDSQQHPDFVADSHCKSMSDVEQTVFDSTNFHFQRGCYKLEKADYVCNTIEQSHKFYYTEMKDYQIPDEDSNADYTITDLEPARNPNNILQNIGLAHNDHDYIELESLKTLFSNKESDARESTLSCLNIHADEIMPAKGELSEQESLAADNSNWALSYQDNSEIRISPLRSFKCPLCNLTFSCPKERRVHKNTVHEQSNTVKPKRFFSCYTCGAKFPTLKLRRQHMSLENHYSFEGQPSILTPIPTRVLTKKTCKTTVGVKIEQQSITIKREIDQPSDSAFAHLVCPKCNETTTSLKSLTEHIKLVHHSEQILAARKRKEAKRAARELARAGLSESKFKCGSCPAFFSQESEYNEHLKTHPLSCDKCDKTFYRKQNLNLHMKRHLDVKPYECPLCPKSFITRQKLEEHTNGHSGLKPLKCPSCDQCFSRHSNLIQHRNLHHLKVKKKVRDYVCRCGEVFHSRKKLEWHKEVHDSKPKTCSFCTQKFVHVSSLTRHVRRMHMPKYLPGDNREEENVHCLVCEKVYLRSSLMVHMRVHSGVRPFPCIVCNKRFSTKWNLQLHSWTHQSRNNMPFKCIQCKSAFFRQSDYIIHMNAHKNLKPFSCNICGQRFIRKYNCLRHQMEHKSNKQFRCTVPDCGKSFHRSYYLKDHLKVHNGVRPYSCHVCGKASSTKSNHNKHVRIHDTREPVNTEN